MFAFYSLNEIEQKSWNMNWCCHQSVSSVWFLNSPNHDDGEVQNVPRISEVGGGMSYEAQGNDSHDALSSEDDGEDDLDLLQEVIGCIAISIGEGGEYSQGDTGTKNCQ